MHRDMKAGELKTEMRRGYNNLLEDIHELENPDSIISFERFMKSVQQYFDAKEAYDLWKAIGGGDVNMSVSEIMDTHKRMKSQEKTATNRKAFFKGIANRANNIASKMEKAATTDK